jgi:hypothetical protein
LIGSFHLKDLFKVCVLVVNELSYVPLCNLHDPHPLFLLL